MNILYTTVVGLLAGVLGTGFGALIAICFRNPSKKVLSIILGFSGGIMLSVVCFDLIPEAIEASGIVYGLTGVILGTMLLSVFDNIIPHNHYIFNNGGKQGKYVRIGLLLGIGIALHNLPEGLAIGSGYAVSAQLGYTLALIIAIQNTPEGIAMAVPMIIGGVSYVKILFIAFLAGLPMGIGAFFGAIIGNISEPFLSLSLGFAGGAMLYITFHELIPQAQKLSKGHSAVFGAVFGVVLGISLHYLL